MSPDDATVATTGHTIKLWDIATGQEKTPSPGGPRRLSSSRWHSAPMGPLWLPVAGTNTVKLWDVATRRERMTLAGPYKFRSVGGLQPRRKAARVDWLFAGS